MTVAFSRRVIVDLVVTTSFVATAYFVIGAVISQAASGRFGSETASFFAVLLVSLLFWTGAVNIIWLGLLGLVVAVGTVKKRPGIAAAPIAFAALCFVAALASRAGVQAMEARNDWNPTIPADAKSYRTLIIDDWWQLPGSIVASHVVDRLVQVSRNSNSHAIERIVETTLGKGDQCSAEERRSSTDLLAVGRIDECYKDRRLDTIPDGLVIAYRYDIGRFRDTSGCCNASEVKRRDGGHETTLFAWRQGLAWVMPYLPYYALPTSRRTGIWQADSAPWQLVRYGRDDIEPPAVAAAIYGVDLKAPATAPELSNDELPNKAEALAAAPVVNTTAVMSLLARLKERGAVDQRTIRIAASLIGHDALDDSVRVFQWKLTPAETGQLLDAALDRIATPGICPTCYGSATSWAMLYNVDDSDRYTGRARHIFEDRSDLALWQYEAALRLATGHLLYEAGYPALDGELFQSVVSDTSPAVGPRVMAFSRVMPASAYERRIMAAKVDLVRDDLLERFVGEFWTVMFPQRDRTPEQQELAQKICGRAARLADAQKHNLYANLGC